MADKTKTKPEEQDVVMLACPLPLAQALANHIRQNSSAGPVDNAIQLLGALNALEKIEKPKAPPSEPISPKKPPTRAKKKATRKARRP
jgi:hypothetical protein